MSVNRILFRIIISLQCTPTSKGKQELNTLKDQLSLVIKTQLDFQQKIENQMTTLQTMMQTLCQLVNHEIISNKKRRSSFFLYDRKHLRASFSLRISS